MASVFVGKGLGVAQMLKLLVQVFICLYLLDQIDMLHVRRYWFEGFFSVSSLPPWVNRLTNFMLEIYVEVFYLSHLVVRIPISRKYIQVSMSLSVFTVFLGFIICGDRHR